MKPYIGDMLLSAVLVKGAYCLCIENNQSQVITISALGEIEFKKGLYVYVGSALNSLYPRLERHLRISRGDHRVFHWHIDYLLREESVGITSIYIVETDESIECKISEKVSELGDPIPHFGCSDCNCYSHLYKVQDFDFLGKLWLKRWV